MSLRKGINGQPWQLSYHWAPSDATALCYLSLKPLCKIYSQHLTFAVSSAAFLLQIHCFGKVHLRGATWHGGSDDATFASLQPSLAILRVLQELRLSQWLINAGL